jgi:hypothetical protein
MGKSVGWTVSSSDLWAPQRWKSPLTVRPAPDVPLRALVISMQVTIASMTGEGAAALWVVPVQGREGFG